MIQKPTKTSMMDAGLQAGAFVAGAKLGDGIVAVVPDSLPVSKKLAVGVVALIASACVPAKNSTSKALQTGLMAMGAKQIYDGATAMLADAVPATAGDSVTAKFTNAVIGHGEVPVASVNAPWVDDSAWLREPYLLEQQPQGGFSGV